MCRSLCAHRLREQRHVRRPDDPHVQQLALQRDVPVEDDDLIAGGAADQLRPASANPCGQRLVRSHPSSTPPGVGAAG